MNVYTNKILEPKDAKLRVHGNGFLQAETACGNKFHIWDPALPRQAVPTKKHNHNHGFTSTVLFGSLTVLEFRICKPIDSRATDPELFVPHQAIPRHDKDTTLEPIGDPVAMTKWRRFIYTEGCMYDYPYDMGLFHEVEGTEPEDITITFVERSSHYNESALPTVLVPVGQEPDNTFDRYQHQEIAEEVYLNACHIIWNYV